MRYLITSICLLIVAAPAGTDIWAGPRQERWTATNQDGFCSLSRSVGSGCSKILFTFALLSREDDQPTTMSFHVTPMQCELAWPVHVSLGPESGANQFDVARNSSTPRSLPSAEADQLLQHLNSGGELYIDYAFKDGIARRTVLGQEGFPQSAAMFKACIAMSPNYAMQRSSRAVTPLATNASGSQEVRSASGAPTARHR